MKSPTFCTGDQSLDAGFSKFFARQVNLNSLGSKTLLKNQKIIHFVRHAQVK
jgi:hypothetical protein